MLLSAGIREAVKVCDTNFYPNTSPGVMHIPPSVTDRKMTALQDGPSFLLTQSPVIHIRRLSTYVPPFWALEPFSAIWRPLPAQTTPNPSAPQVTQSAASRFHPQLPSCQGDRKGLTLSAGDVGSVGGLCLNLSGFNYACLPDCFNE